ncbi:MAG TPA: LysR family transcriptional regulator [Aliidongia sp.]|nr:LysR family transcriptional regulator [Aliidongia sp.]
MELRHIRYFLAVAQELNFTRAAALVHIGQPPLSQHIKDLDAEVGAQLFRRLAQGAELTVAGRAFLEQIEGVLPQVERAKVAAQRAARGEIGSLHVGFTSSSAFSTVVPSAIRSFRRAYPEVDLSLEEAGTTRLTNGLLKGELDIVFLRPGATVSQDLQIRLLSEEPMLVALPTCHPAAAANEISLIDLRDEPFILFPRATGATLFDTIIAACRDAGFEPILGQSAPQIDSIVNLVAAELGVSLVPASMNQLQVSGVVYREIAGVAPIARLALAVRRGETSKVVRNFITQAVS